MSLAQKSTLLLAAIAGLATMATELQESGAVRPDHETKWGGFRVAIDQAQASAAELDQAAADAAPANPDAAAFEQLGHQVETMALTLDSLSDQVAALKAG